VTTNPKKPNALGVDLKVTVVMTMPMCTIAMRIVVIATFCAFLWLVFN